MMAQPHRIGSRLDRDVKCVAVSSADDFRGLTMEHALVLVALNDARWTPEARAHLAKQVVARGPLGVFVTGKYADEMFDELIHVLDAPDPQPIMTNFSSSGLREAVDEFLSATWPAEETWERWKEYLLVTIRGSVLELEASAQPLIDA